MAQPVGAERVQAGADVVGAAQLAAVGREQQAGALGDPEGGAKSAVVPRRSSLERPNAITPRSAYCPARRASVRASRGWRVRLAAIITPIGRPVAAVADRTASSTRSVNAVIPPKRAPYPLGSTWISSHLPPSVTSSSAASSTRRRTSSSVRSTDRATS